MACNEAYDLAAPFSGIEVARSRNGLSVNVDEVALGIADTLQQHHPEDDEAMGFAIDGFYVCHLAEYGWVKLPISAAVALQSIARHRQGSGAHKIWVPETVLPDIIELSKSSGMKSADGQLEKYLTFANSSRVAHPQPSGLKATLDAAQIEGFSWLVDLHDHGISGILADEMGIGKTMQIIALVLYLKERGNFKRSMISVPAGAVDHWMSEFGKFAPSLETLAWEGTQRRNLLPILDAVDVVVTTHKLLTIDHAILRQHDWTVFAIDEAQDGKNPESELASSSALLPAVQKIPVTGTPVENSLIDLHTLMTIAAPGLLGRQVHFKRDISDKVKKDEDAEVILNALHKVVSPFLKHRTQQSAGLSIPPPKVEEIRLAFKEDAEAYANVRDLTQAMLKDGSGSIFQLITMLRQASADYRLMQERPRGHESTKTSWIADRVAYELNQGRKILVFSTWTTHLDILREAILTRGINPERLQRIDGSKNRKEKRWAEEDFKSGPVDVLEMTMRAGGRSLNLPEADTVILGVPWWNPSVMRQAAYRAVRRGQTKIIDVLIPIMADSIEVRLMDIQDQKSRISHSILRPASGFGGLTRKELENLINGA